MTVITASPLEPGKTDFLGATPRNRQGTNFVFYTDANATGVDLCLFNAPDGASDETRHTLVARKTVKEGEKLVGYLWSGFAPKVGEGAWYGFRVHGSGHNPHKLLLDPNAKALNGEIHEWKSAHRFDNDEDSASVMPKSMVIDWQALHREAGYDAPGLGKIRPLADSIIKEMLVGDTLGMPGIANEEQGKIKALSSDAFIAQIKKEGFNAIELMPMESFGTDRPLEEKGKKNRWGYQPIGCPSVHTDYAATSNPAREFMETVRKLKKNGIEVFMDVVPHTVESAKEDGVVNLRGQDKTLYLDSDMTGAGNTPDFGHPMNVRMLLERFKYWRKMGVAGFRGDLFTVTGREHGHAFSPSSPVMTAIREDPELQDVKWMGESYDTHGFWRGGLSSVPAISDAAKADPAALKIQSQDPKRKKWNRIAEWETEGRDIIEAVALNHAEEMSIGTITKALVGSPAFWSDPQTRVVISPGPHDGATLKDAVSYSEQDNRRNGEGNNDGHKIPPGQYWGNEDDRLRVQAFNQALVGISQGPILERIGNDQEHTQQGNTNPYYWDREADSQYNKNLRIKHGDEIHPQGRVLKEFSASVRKFREKHCSMRRATLFTGESDKESPLTYAGKTLKDVTWLHHDKRELNSEDMLHPGAFGMLLSGDPGNSPEEEKNPARRVQGRTHDIPLLFLINPTMQDRQFTLPEIPGINWKPAYNTLEPLNLMKGEEVTDTTSHSAARAGGQTIKLGWKSMIAFEAEPQVAKDKFVEMIRPAQRVAPPGKTA